MIGVDVVDACATVDVVEFFAFAANVDDIADDKAEIDEFVTVSPFVLLSAHFLVVNFFAISLAHDFFVVAASFAILADAFIRLCLSLSFDFFLLFSAPFVLLL